MYENNCSIRYVGTLPGDVAHLFTIGSKDLKYVIKFNNYRNRTKEVVNEYIVGKLAERLSLPVLPVKPIYVSEHEIKHFSEKREENVIEAGFHISLPYIDQCASFNEFIQHPRKDELINQGELAGMIVFDQWINNSDRSRTNILFQQLPSGYRFLMIDHGRCFPGGYNWTVESLKQKVELRTNMPVYKWATTLLNHEDDLRSFTQQILSLDEKSIYEIISSTPQDWFITDEEKEQLVQFLIKQQQDLPDLIERYIKTYRHLIKG